MSCLSDENLAALVDGSASDEQLSVWHDHIATCDSCAAKAKRRQAGVTGASERESTVEAASAGSSDPDATLSVKPVGKPNLDAKAELPPSDAIPGYRILKELHWGGQGVVYQAVQESTRRKVALKVMLEGPFAGKDSRHRFEREIAVVGSLRHPGIVPIFDSGQAQGRFFYAMEYIRGERLSEYVHSRKLSVDETLKLFKKVCDAVDYAHQKGVIHRDLKPSNILADASGEPHVLDFGLAKIGGAEAGDQASLLVSVTGQVMGTPAYMSPEQAAGRPDQVDMRSDVYSLGVILYELLTGELPYDLSGQMAENLTTIQRAEPQRPRTIRGQINDEVETIVLKTLSKDKTRRYEMAGSLGKDIGRLLAGEPIEAKRDSVLYVLRKTLHRYKAPVAVAASFVILVTVGLIVSLALWRQAAHERRNAEIAGAHAQDSADEAQVARAAESALRSAAEQLSLDLAFERGLTLCEQGKVGEGMLWLARTLERLEPVANELPEFDRVIRENLAAWRGEMHALQDVLRHESSVFAAAFSPDGSRIVTGGTKDFFVLWTASTGQRTGTIFKHRPRNNAVAFSPDGKRVLTGGVDNTARLWVAETGALIGPMIGHQDIVNDVAFSPDGRYVATASFDKTARLWDAKTLALIGSPLQHPGQVCTVAFSPDGKRFLTGCEDGEARLWSTATGERIGHTFVHEASIQVVAFSPNGSRVLTGSQDATARLWDAETGNPIGRPLTHLSRVMGGSFSHNGSLVITSAFDNAAQIWDTTTLDPVGAPVRHQGPIFAAIFRPPDSARILTVSLDNSARLWSVSTGRALGRPLQHKARVDALAFSPNGSMIVTGTADGTVQRWDSANLTSIGPPMMHQGYVGDVTFSPDGARILTGSGDKTARLWDAETGRAIGEPIRYSAGVNAVAFNPDGSRMAIATWKDNTIWLHDAATGKQPNPFVAHDARINATAFAPKGSRLVTASDDNTAKIWDAVTGEMIGKPLKHRGPVRGAAFSPDASLILTASDDATALVWDAATGRPLGDALHHDAPVVEVVFSPNGRRVLTGSADHTARLWDLATRKPIGTSFKHRGAVWQVAFAPDGSRALTGGADNTARMWNTTVRPVQGHASRIVLWTQVITGLGLDERGKVYVLDAETWRQRRDELQTLGGPPIP